MEKGNFLASKTPPNRRGINQSIGTSKQKVAGGAILTCSVKIPPLVQENFTSTAETDCAEFAFCFHAIESMALGLLLPCSISLKDHT